MKTHTISKRRKELFKPFILTDFDIQNNKKSLRWLAWCAIFLGFTVVVIGNLVYGLDTAFTSISASANYYGTAYLLPFILGCMAIFFWDYIGYAKFDRIVTKTMSIAAIFVAMFQCDEFGGRSIPQKMGFFGLPPNWSNLIHIAAAIVLFLSLILWIIFLFTLSKDETTGNSVWKWKTLTKKKKIRNSIYILMGAIGLVGLVFAIMSFCKVTGVPFIWFGELIILLSAGFALLVKSGWQLFAD